MGMQTNINYGYGFQIDSVKPSALIDFIINHQKTFCESEKEIEIFKNLDNPDEETYIYEDMEGYFEDYGYECESSGQEGFGAVISNIMRRETGIRFSYERGQDECDSVPSVLLCETCPWCFNEVERDLTEDSMFNICKKYVEELGIFSVGNDIPIGYLSVEHYG